MHSNDDHSSVPACEIRTRTHAYRDTSFGISRGLFVTLIVAAFLFVATPRFAAQTPSEAPAQTAQQPQAQAVPPARTIELDDFAKISSVSDPQISPDGKSIAFVR